VPGRKLTPRRDLDLSRKLPLAAIAAVTICVASVSTAGEAAAGWQRDADVLLRLDDAFWLSNKGNDQTFHISLEGKIRNGELLPNAYGYAVFYPAAFKRVAYNKADHNWRLLSAKIQGDRIVLGARLRANPDIWGTGGGRGLYDITLQRTGDRLEGTYTGTFEARRMQGRAAGTLSAPWPAPIEGHVPVKPGEHPRLIFRRSDIPGLKARAKTPEGRQIIAMLKKALEGDIHGENCGFHAAGHAFLYVLTGNESHARRATEIVKKTISFAGYKKKAGGGGNIWRNARYKRIMLAPPRVGIALAYDMLYEYWDEALRHRMTEELEEKARELIIGNTGQEYNDATASNHYGICNGAGGLVALAILGEKGPCDPEPEDPGRIQRIEPPKDFQPGEGVPVVPFQDDQMPTRWLLAGPFKPQSADIDFLKAIGGRAEANPAVGTEVTYKGQTLKFRRLDAKWIYNTKYSGHRNSLDMLTPIGRDFHSTIIYYNVLRNDKARLVQVRKGHGGIRMWVAGREVQEGQFVELAAGLLPILVQAPVGRTDPWGMIWCTPRFAGAGRDDVEAARAKYLLRHAEWTEGLAEYNAAAAGRPEARRLAELAEARMRRHLSTAFGDRGWNTEGNGYKRYALSQGVLPYLHAYRNVTGRDFVRKGRHDWLLTLWVMRTIVRDGRAEMQVYGPGHRQLDQSFYHSGEFAMGFSSVTARYKPAVLWLFERTRGTKGNKTFDIFHPHHAIYAMRNYPFGLEVANPCDILPRAVRDTVRGGYVFRKQWRDGDDFVATIHTKETPALGWNFFDGGSFRISALGTHWALRNIQGRSGGPELENRVQVEGIYARLGGVTRSYVAGPDGSGVVTIDMSRSYLGPQDRATKEFADLGIRAMRSFAVDYSESSGAPGLFAVVDGFTARPGSGPAGGTKTWRMHTGGKVRAEGSTFTIRGRDGATMKGTFVAPSDVKIAVEEGWIINATGGEEFFVVMTVQRGRPPEVKVSGAGLKAKAIVGAQTISFDGEKIVLSRQAPAEPRSGKGTK
jgi:hypothetical protein